MEQPDSSRFVEPEYVILPLTPEQARQTLRLNTSPDILVMCRGYNDEDNTFTELFWEDDAELEFEDSVSYPEFQLWLRFWKSQDRSNGIRDAV